MKNDLSRKMIQTLWIPLLLLGAIFFHWNIFVSPFYLFPAIWIFNGVAVIALLFCFLRKTLSLPVGTIMTFLLITLIAISDRSFIYNSLLGVLLTSLFFRFCSENDDLFKGRITLFFHFFSLTAFVICLYSSLQYAGFIPSHHTDLPLTGPFDNPAGLTGILAMLSPFVIYHIKYNHDFQRYLHILLLVFIAVILCLSESRTGITAFTVIVGLELFSYRFKANKKLTIALSILLFLLTATGLYFLKKDSADGRLLIWKVSAGMIQDNPVIGLGSGAFEIKYMDYQAEYFKKNRHSEFTLLADNITHPFNEYLKVAGEFGIIGLLVLLFFAIYLIYTYRKEPSQEKQSALMALLALAVFSLFSYPLNYPATWVIVAFSISIILWRKERVIILKNKIWKGVLSTLITLFLFSISYYSLYEYKWNKLAQAALRGEDVTDQYKDLYPVLKYNGLFLYNLGAELRINGKIPESIQVLEECKLYLNDLDIQLLLGDCYIKLKQYKNAEACFTKACFMCPVRFIPSYYLVKLYAMTGETDKARKIAMEILQKPIKIPSREVYQIKQEIKQFLSDPDCKF